MVYPPKQSRCNNCTLSLGTGKSNNVYIHGGPIQFPLGAICPMCGGGGFRFDEEYDIIRLLVNENIKTFDKSGMPNNVNFPDGVIQTKGFMRDFAKVKKCAYMIKHIAIADLQTMKYKLFGEPLCPGNIIQGTFFIANWQRIA